MPRSNRLIASVDFSHENEHFFGDSDGRIVDLRFQRVRGASVTLPSKPSPPDRIITIIIGQDRHDLVRTTHRGTK